MKKMLLQVCSQCREDIIKLRRATLGIKMRQQIFQLSRKAMRPEG